MSTLTTFFNNNDCQLPKLTTTTRRPATTTTTTTTTNTTTAPLTSATTTAPPNANNVEIECWRRYRDGDGNGGGSSDSGSGDSGSGDSGSGNIGSGESGSGDNENVAFSNQFENLGNGCCMEQAPIDATIDLLDFSMSISGDCGVSSEAGHCVASDGFTRSRKYGRNDYCTITVTPGYWLHVQSFHTESVDTLTVNGVEYSGDNPLDLYNVTMVHDGSITWDTDSSVQYAGWELCFCAPGVAVCEGDEHGGLTGKQKTGLGLGLTAAFLLIYWWWMCGTNGGEVPCFCFPCCETPDQFEKRLAYWRKRNKQESSARQNHFEQQTTRSYSRGSSRRPTDGDSVCLASDYRDHGDASGGPLSPGDVGTVVQDDQSGKPFKVKFGSKSWWYKEKAIQLATGAVSRVLPDGWKLAESRSYPGEYVYENVHTGERQAWEPTEAATSGDLYAETGTYGESPLYTAASYGQEDVVEQMLHAASDYITKTVTIRRPDLQTAFGFRIMTTDNGIQFIGGVKPNTDNCPHKHGLTQFATRHSGYGCDVCTASQAVGATMHGCRQCDYDVCASCRSETSISAGIVEENDIVKSINGTEVTDMEHGVLVDRFLRTALEVTFVLLRETADLSVVNKALKRTGETALLVASKMGYHGIVKLLLSAGASVDKAMTTSGRTPLYSAACNGNTDAVKALLVAGASIDRRRYKQRKSDTALMGAAEGGHVDSLKLLLEAGADFKLTNTEGDTAADIAKSKSGREYREIAKVLVKYERAEAEVKDRKEEEAKEEEARKRAEETGTTPLYTAAQKGQEDVIDQLLATNVDVDKALVETGETALLVAAKMGHVEILKKLLAAGASIDKAMTTSGRTALYTAAANESEKSLVIVKVLLAVGASVDKAKTDRIAGYTALMIAAREGNVRTVQLLLDAGADFKLENSLGGTAATLAEQNNHIEVIALFKVECSECGKQVPFNYGRPDEDKEGMFCCTDCWNKFTDAFDVKDGATSTKNNADFLAAFDKSDTGTLFEATGLRVDAQLGVGNITLSFTNKAADAFTHVTSKIEREVDPWDASALLMDAQALTETFEPNVASTQTISFVCTKPYTTLPVLTVNLQYTKHTKTSGFDEDTSEDKTVTLVLTIPVGFSSFMTAPESSPWGTGQFMAKWNEHATGEHVMSVFVSTDEQRGGQKGRTEKGLTVVQWSPGEMRSAMQAFGLTDMPQIDPSLANVCCAGMMQCGKSEVEILVRLKTLKTRDPFKYNAYTFSVRASNESICAAVMELLTDGMKETTVEEIEDLRFNPVFNNQVATYVKDLKPNSPEHEEKIRGDSFRYRSRRGSVGKKAPKEEETDEIFEGFGEGEDAEETFDDGFDEVGDDGYLDATAANSAAKAVHAGDTKLSEKERNEVIAKLAASAFAGLAIDKKMTTTKKKSRPETTSVLLAAKVELASRDQAILDEERARIKKKVLPTVITGTGPRAKPQEKAVSRYFKSKEHMQKDSEPATKWLMRAIECAPISTEASDLVQRLLGTHGFTANLEHTGQWGTLRKFCKETLNKIGENALKPLYDEFELGKHLSNFVLQDYFTFHALHQFTKPSQAMVFPQLFDALRDELDFNDPAVMAQRISACAFILLCTLIHPHFKAKIEEIGKEAIGEWCSVQIAETKGYARALVKIMSDYFKLESPRVQWILDPLRCLLIGPNALAICSILGAFSDATGGFLQVKNAFNLSEKERGKRSHPLLINTTIVVDTGKTIAELVNGPEAEKIFADFCEVKNHGEPSSRWTFMCKKAMEILRFNIASTKGETVKVGAEMQITLDSMSEPRDHMHHAYNYDRADNQDAVLINFAADNNALREGDDNMYNACWAGDLEKIKAIGRDANFNLAENLFVASENNHPDVVAHFLTLVESAEVITVPRVETGETPSALHKAVQNGHIDIVTLLVAKCNMAGASVDVPINNNAKTTALHLASRNPSSEIVDLLLSAGASVDGASADDVHSLKVNVALMG